MNLDGVHGDDEAGGDLLVGKPVGSELDGSPLITSGLAS